MRILIILIIAIGLVACKPKPTFMQPPSGGGEMYQKAWREGCESGYAAYGNAYWRTFYNYKADIKLMNTNKIYSRVWWDSFNYCRHYVNRYLALGFWGSEGGGKKENFNQDLRNERIVEVEGFSFPWWHGASTPGWGEHTWDGDVDQGKDWLWRDPNYIEHH